MKVAAWFVSPIATSLLIIGPGCSPSGKSTAPAASTASPSSNPTPSVNCDDPNISSDDWAKYCGKVEGQPSESASEETRISSGQSFEYISQTDKGPGTTFKVQLSRMDCEMKSLPKTDSNPKWDGSDDKLEYIPAKAPKGSDFCVLYWSWENVGKKPGTVIQSGDLMFGDERFARDSDDEMRSWTFMETNMGVGYTDEINPRKKTKSADIYTVEEGKTPNAAWFPMDTFVDDVYVLVETK